MIRTDIRIKANRPKEIAEKIELMGWHKLNVKEQDLCGKYIHEVLPFLSPEKKKLVAAIYNVVPTSQPRRHIGKSFIIQQHKSRLTRRRRLLGAQLTKMTVAETIRWLDTQNPKPR